jgi:isopentenyl diphosphate isomerase/L-lactate dehydrogenase-like FMN-dependent dehydrogenase
MTVAGAEKALKAGAYGIVVSNHGGRVLDETPSTLSVLPEISKAVGGKLKIFIDGGVRSGLDVFKALALGADAVLIARPFVTAVYGGGADGVSLYVENLQAELINAMLMTGCQTLNDIDESKVSSI